MKTNQSNILFHPVEQLLRTPGLTVETVQAIKHDLGLVKNNTQQTVIPYDSHIVVNGDVLPSDCEEAQIVMNDAGHVMAEKPNLLSVVQQALEDCMGGEPPGSGWVPEALAIIDALQKAGFIRKDKKS